MGLTRKDWSYLKDARLRELYTALEAFLDQNYTFRKDKRYQGFFGFFRAISASSKAEKEDELENGAWNNHVFFSSPNGKAEWLKNHLEQHKRDSFSACLMRMMIAKKLDHVEVYKRGGVDRRLFSKIISDYEYTPSKKTVIALAIGMRLNLEETETLLNKAGFHLSEDILFDMILKFFIKTGNYDLVDINTALYEYKAPLLS